MSKTPWTQGPWRIGDAGNTIFGPKTDAPAPVMVASVGPAGRDPVAKKANAQLIALAPEMVEVLQQVLGALSGANAISYDDIESADVELLLEDIKSAHAVARMILSRLPKGE